MGVRIPAQIARIAAALRALLGRIAAWLGARLLGLAWATLAANTILVVTGGAVRLTGSGLGCPTWPRCTDESFTPHGAVSLHSAIEFGNRMLTFVLVAIAVLTLIAAVQAARANSRPSIARVALVLALGIPAQAVIGGITVLTDLNPWIVSLHLICSLAIICLAVGFIRIVPARRPAHSGPPALRALAWANAGAAAVVLYIGTVVTGSGPHAGDEDAPRNGLDPLQLSQLHADVVFLFVGLTLGLAFALRATGAGGEPRRAVRVLLSLQVAQGAIGFVQYFTDLPIVLVGLHMLGAALIAAATTWVVLATEDDPARAARDRTAEEALT